MSSGALFALVAAALASVQAQAILGFIFLDLIFGIAAAFRQRRFHWDRLADFYTTNVIPYLIGYVAVYVAVNLMIPPDALGGYGDMLSDAGVLVAWTTLMGTLGASIAKNWQKLYGAGQR